MLGTSRRISRANVDDDLAVLSEPAGDAGIGAASGMLGVPGDGAAKQDGEDEAYEARGSDTLARSQGERSSRKELCPPPRWTDVGAMKPDADVSKVGNRHEESGLCTERLRGGGRRTGAFSAETGMMKGDGARCLRRSRVGISDQSE